MMYHGTTLAWLPTTIPGWVLPDIGQTLKRANQAATIAWLHFILKGQLGVPLRTAPFSTAPHPIITARSG